MKSNPKNRLARLILPAIIASATLVLTASHALAVTTYQGAADDWTIPANWSGGVVPTGAFNQRLNFNGGTTVTFSAAQGTVDAGAAAGESRSIVLGNANPNASTGTATLNITGGTLRAGIATAASSLIGANGVNSTGILNVSGNGILDLTTATSTAGRLLSIGLAQGANAGISGTVNLSGTGMIKVGEFRFNESAAVGVGGSITGVLNLNGGTLETGTVREAGSGAVTSTVNLNGGLLKLTGTAGINSNLDTVNVLSGGANIEVITGIASVAAEALLDGGGGGGLVKTGDGSLALSGNNTYTGATRINAGTLRFTTQGSLYNGVSANWTAAKINALSGTTFAVSGDSAGIAGFNSTNLDTLLANISMASSATEGLQAGATLGIDTSTATGASFTQGNAIANSTGANGGSIGLIKLGSGVLVLDKANTHSGTTTIPAGAIIVTANGALGTVASGTTVGPDASLGLSGGVDYTTTETITGSGTGSAIITGVLPSVSRGLIQSVSGNNTFRGNIVVDAGGISRIGTQDAASLTLTGTITQAAGSILFRAGNGPLLPTPNTGGDFVTLSNAGNSFGADSTIFTGAITGYSGVRLGITNALPTGLTISGSGGGTPTAAGTALDLAGFNQSLNGLIGTATLNIINTNTNIGTSSALTLNPTADRSTTGTVILGGTGLSGLIGTINLIKQGTFTQALAGANTYTGTTTVNDGTLLINGNSVGATGAVSVNNTSTFGGSGTIGGNVTITAAANLAPGASAGTFTISGNLDISAMAGGAGQLKYELDALAGINDRLTVGGTVNLGTLALDDLAVTNLGGLQVGTYTLMTSAGLSGTVNGATALIATGFNGKLQTNANSLEIVVTAAGAGSAYDTWKAANAPGSNPNEDTDGDGVTNAVEFVLGGTTPTNDIGKLPVLAASGSNMTLTFIRDRDSIDPGKTTVTIEVSTDLATWNTPPSPYAVPDVVTAGPPVAVVNNGDGTDTVTLTVAKAPDAKKFARLKVVITP